MMAIERVFLIGPMGAGKTTVGRRLAVRLGLPFVDLDQCIVERTGVGVPLIFEIEGEQGFRDRESRLLDEYTQHARILLATGGGAVLRAENRERLHGRGLVVFLDVPVDLQLQRLARDRQRPLLQAPNRRERLQDLSRERDALYRQTAHLVVRSENRRPAAMAERLQKLIHNTLEVRHAQA